MVKLDTFLLPTLRSHFDLFDDARLLLSHSFVYMRCDTCFVCREREGSNPFSRSRFQKV